LRRPITREEGGRREREAPEIAANPVVAHRSTSAVSATRRVEVRWQHASNGVKVAIHANFLADDVRVGAEAAVPASVADHLANALHGGATEAHDATGCSCG